MSKFYGVRGNTSFAASQKHLRYFLTLLIAIAIIAHLAGFTAGLALTSPVISYIPLTLLLVLLWVAKRRVSRILDDLQAASVAFRKGADSKTLTIDTLARLPDTYAVFHDVNHPELDNDIDYIVVGPTGVFVLETKDWRGMITLSGQGTLSIDGKHDHSPTADAALTRAKKLKLLLETLSSIDVFVQTVLVFPHASVHVSPGTHSPLAVQRLNLLAGFLTEPVPTRQLTPQQVAAITRDLQALFKSGAKKERKK